MFTQSEYIAIRINNDARDRAFAEAENHRKLHQAGLVQPSRLSILARRGVGSLGRMMVIFGQRLAQVDAAQKTLRAPAGFEGA